MLRITSLFVVLFYGASAEAVPDLGTTSSCFPTFMRVEVDLTKNPDLVAGEIHLNDRNCRATQTSATLAVFDIPLHSCGTVQDGSSPDYLHFSNTVRWEPTSQGGERQTRIYGFVSQINCKYNRNGTASVAIQPVNELSINQTEYGTFTFVMDVFTDSARNLQLDRTASVVPGTALYFRVEVKSGDTDLVLHLDKCWARNSDFSGQHVFIENGCNNGKETSLEYSCSQEPIQDFKINAFRILNSPDDRVFFLCDVLVCIKNAPASTCTDRCNKCTAGLTGRKRRSLEDNYDSGSNVYSLAVGPYSVTGQSNGDRGNQEDAEETEVKGTQLSLTMILIVCVTSIVAVAMICATIVVVIAYKRWSSRQQTGTVPAARAPTKPKVFKL